MAFTQKQISVSLSLANGNFSGGGNSLNLTGLRVKAKVSIPGGNTMALLECAIYGIPLQVMNQLSLVGTQFNTQSNNTVTVTAGDSTSGMAQVYKGTIVSAFVDAQQMPNVAFHISGSAGSYQAVQQTPPTSIQGSGDVAQMMQTLAGTMGFQFENNGVSQKLSNPYLYGAPRMQALRLAKMAGIEHVIDPFTSTLAIWKPGKSRSGSIIIAPPPTGDMVGYPMFNQNTVIVRTLFSPQIQYGGSMTIQSSLTPACGTYVINNVDLDLESQVPHGKWFATLQGLPQNTSEIDP